MSVTCDVDVAGFQALCRMPLRQGWNLWLLGRTLDDDPPAHDLGVYARRVVQWWFAEVGARTGTVDNFEARVLDRDDWQKSLSELGGGRPIVASSDECDAKLEPERLDFRGDSGFRVVLVRFVYRGSRKDLPWPVSRAVILPGQPGPTTATAEWCPKEADWIALAAYEDREDVPPPKDPIDLDDPLGLKALAEAAGEVLVPLAVIAVAAAVVIIGSRLVK